MAVPTEVVGVSGHGVEVIDEGPVFGAQMGPGVGQGPDEAGCVVVGQGPVQFADGRRGGRRGDQ
ncbi:hypothetical protein K7B10_00265 [Streptomyces flavotricini]|uniref:Uncharacterized protein n=1 Tax=Streptomyces flavotricini TaxID=66888 RepID=A0ABS8DXY3_9ACTN|nr:hypothetical protein [Streptomyces flavotricini]